MTATICADEVTVHYRVYWGYNPEECDLKALNRALDRAHKAHGGHRGYRER